jgi:AI-2E family transporter
VTAGIITAVVFVVYTQIENHVLNPVVMSKTVRVSPLFVLVSVLVGASIGGWLGGVFGGLVAALLAVPTAAALQTVIRELWRETSPDSSSPPANGNLSDRSCPAWPALSRRDCAELNQQVRRDMRQACVPLSSAGALRTKQRLPNESATAARRRSSCHLGAQLRASGLARGA